MPLTVPAGLLTKANFITAYLKPLVDANETNAASALSTGQAAQTTANQKYTKPSGGIPGTDLAATAAVQNDGTVLRVVALSQTAYDALASKVSTTLYVIV